MIQEQYSETVLQAYVDGELDHAESDSLLEAMMQHPELKTRVCQLQHLKGLVNNAFPLESGIDDDAFEVAPKRRSSWFAGVAGAFLGAIAAIAASYQLSDNTMGNQIATAIPPATGGQNNLVAVPQKVLLHLDSSDEEVFDETLDYAEQLLREYGSRGIRVEVMANAGGVDLFREETSPYKKRLKALAKHYENLQFIACANAIANIRKRGEAVHLFPSVHDNVTALDHVVKRLREGWRYVKI
ncbi:MAG TPA: hypothetical protein ENJ35_08830 [Gammaproteobacteria bacterium]|nr:hypothetical protein [Gammaproteobacteria bacterium]